MPSAEFEPAIPAITRRQTYALDRTAKEIAFLYVYLLKSAQITVWAIYIFMGYVHTISKFSIGPTEE
jgi:hypothetical protein